MVGGGRAARQHQFDQRHARGDPEMLRREARPHALERDQPGHQFLAEAGGVSARQRLVEVVMSVDEAGQDDVARRVEHGVDRRGGAGGAAADQFDDLRSLDDEAPLGPFSENGERVLDP